MLHANHKKHTYRLYWMKVILMALVKKTIELDQDQINRIKIAMNAKSEKEAINAVLRQFDTDIQIAEATLKDAGRLNFEEI